MLDMRFHLNVVPVNSLLSESGLAGMLLLYFQAAGFHPLSPHQLWRESLPKVCRSRGGILPSSHQFYPDDASFKHVACLGLLKFWFADALVSLVASLPLPAARTEW